MARGIVWLGLAAAAVLIAGAAVIGLRGTAPPPGPAPQNAAVAQPQPAAAAPASAPAAKTATASPAPAKPPSFDIVSVDPQGQAVIAGRAAPGDRVRVLDGDRAIGEVTADARGEWVLVPSVPIMPGNRQLNLEATAPGGGPVRRSGDVVALSVPPPVAAGASPSTLAVLLPGDTNQPARVLQPPVPAAPGQPLALDSAEYGAGRGLALSGHASPGARLNIYAGDRLLGTATADEAGKWSLLSPRQLPAGSIELRLDELAADGSVARRIAAPFEPPAAVAVARDGSYIVRRGNSLWLIARHIYGQGIRYTTIYGANRDQIRNPDLIYPGQHFKLPKS